MKKIYLSLFFCWSLIFIACNMPTNANQNTNNTNSEIEDNTPNISPEMMDKAEKALNYVKNNVWVSEKYKNPAGDYEDPEYDESKIMYLKLENNTLKIFNKSGVIYKTFDVNLNNLSEYCDKEKLVYFKVNGNDETRLLVYPLYDFNTLMLRLNNGYIGEPSRYYEDFMVLEDNNSQLDNNDSEIINNIKGDWNYTASEVNRNFKITITDNEIKINTDQGIATAKYTVKNSKINIKYTEIAADNSTTVDYEGTFDITLLNNGFKISSTDYNAASIYGMFFNCSTTDSNYEIIFSK